MTPDDPRHGTHKGVPTHRRAGQAPCDACRDANALYQRRQRKIRALYGNRMVSNRGARRRVQALMRLGWSAVAICERTGMSQSNLWNSLKRPTGLINAATAQRVADAYEDMSMTLPPTDNRSQRISVARSRGLAERRGWAPPLAWDDIDADARPIARVGAPKGVDLVVVERLLAGQRIPSTPEDKREAMRRWLADGKSQRSLCAMHGWAENRYTTQRTEGTAA